MQITPIPPVTIPTAGTAATPESASAAQQAAAPVVTARPVRQAPADEAIQRRPRERKGRRRPPYGEDARFEDEAAHSENPPPGPRLFDDYA